MEAVIRKVQQGDANTLAYIQTESWKAAFAGILDAETLEKCTDIDRATAMYQRLLDENKGNGYLLSVDGTPHCIAYWDTARDAELTGKAELICIHTASKQSKERLARLRTAGRACGTRRIFCGCGDPRDEGRNRSNDP